MARFPKDAPRRKVVRALGELGFEVVREGSHIAMRRRSAVARCGSGTAMRQPGSSIRTEQTNFAADRFPISIRANSGGNRRAT